MDKKIRLIYDECNPTAQRRPTTYEDVMNDIHIEEFDNREELLDRLMDLSGLDNEYFNLNGYKTISCKIDRCLKELSPIDFGNANILYLNIFGKTDYDISPYYCLNDLDLSHCSEDDIKQAIIKDEELIEGHTPTFEEMLDKVAKAIGIDNEILQTAKAEIQKLKK